MTRHTTDEPSTPDIRPGGIVHDLGQPGWPAMWVVRKEADSVADYRDERDVDLMDYEKNILSGVSPDDAVYLVQYITDGPLSTPKTQYPIPESRLGPQDVMAADHIGDDPVPVQHPVDQVAEDVLTAILTQMDREGYRDAYNAVIDAALACDAVHDDDVIRRAEELAEADRVGRDADTDADPDVDVDDDQLDDDRPDADRKEAAATADDGLGDFNDFDGGT